MSTCSPARLAANRRNARKSTGPRTDAGKERSRANALKHGLAAEVVVPDEDVEAVAERLAEFEEELRPGGGVGRFLAMRAAVLSVRLDRAVRHEAAMVSREVRLGERRYEDERRTYVEEMGDALREAPATVVRRLKAMPEGIDWLVAAWQGLKADLLHPTRDLWDSAHWDRVENLMGRRPIAYPASELEPLSRAAWGDFGGLGPDQGAGLPDPGRVAWARRELGRRIDAEVAALEALRPGLDHAAIAADRAEAGRRALFDPSPAATLARKYEAAAERGLFRTLREFREAEAAAPPGAVDPPAPLGSFVPTAPEPEAAPPDAGCSGPQQLREHEGGDPGHVVGVGPDFDVDVEGPPQLGDVPAGHVIADVGRKGLLEAAGPLRPRQGVAQPAIAVGPGRGRIHVDSPVGPVRWQPRPGPATLEGRSREARPRSFAP